MGRENGHRSCPSSRDETRSIKALNDRGMALYMLVDAGPQAVRVFDTVQQLDNAVSTIHVSPSALAPDALSGMPGVAPEVGPDNISGCPYTTYGAYMFINSNCGSTSAHPTWHVGQAESVPYLSTYGWNDEASSVSEEDKIIQAARFTGGFTTTPTTTLPPGFSRFTARRLVGRLISAITAGTTG